jgi:hypothetical protein
MDSIEIIFCGMLPHVSVTTITGRLATSNVGIIASKAKTRLSPKEIVEYEFSVHDRFPFERFDCLFKAVAETIISIERS